MRCKPTPPDSFIDAFVIGDGEEVVKEIIDCYKECKLKSGFHLKEDVLNKLSELEDCMCRQYMTLLRKRSKKSCFRP